MRAGKVADVPEVESLWVAYGVARNSAAGVSARSDHLPHPRDPAHRFGYAPVVHCPNCGYHLQGLPAPRCPECGREFDPAALPQSTEVRADAPFWRLLIAATLIVGACSLVLATVMGQRVRHHHDIILAVLALSMLPIALGSYAFALRRSSPYRLRYAMLGLIAALLGLGGLMLVPALGR